MSGPELGPRALNRALLERQLLLRRSAMPAVAAVGHLVGMQAQAVLAPYTGLWSRVTDFTPDALADRLVDRSLVRIALMRGTVHLVTAEDCLPLRRFTRPLYEAALANQPALRGIDLVRVASLGRKWIETEPRTNAELWELFAEHLPEFDPAACTWALRSLLACVQVPPRGIWGATGRPRFTTAEHWLDEPAEADLCSTAGSAESADGAFGEWSGGSPGGSPGGSTDPLPLVRRYLAAYGPASVQDMQSWCGLTRLSEAFEALRPGLRVFIDPGGGRELFDLPDAPLPDPGSAAPVRFLPEYDNCLRSHADRSRVVPDAIRPHLQSRNDAPIPTFLVDGFVAGRWRIERRRKTATMHLVPFRRLSKRHAAAVSAEADRWLTFAAADAESRDIRLADPPE